MNPQSPLLFKYVAFTFSFESLKRPLNSLLFFAKATVLWRSMIFVFSNTHKAFTMLSSNSPSNTRMEEPFDHLSEYKKSQNCSARIETKNNII